MRDRCMLGLHESFSHVQLIGLVINRYTVGLSRYDIVRIMAVNSIFSAKFHNAGISGGIPGLQNPQSRILGFVT